MASWLCLLVIGSTAAAAENYLEFAPAKGHDTGKHVVLLAGDEEYRSEEGLPMLAKILSQHGFRCTVLFAVDSDGTINPNNAESLSHPEALDKADCIVMLIRFRHYPDAVMQRFEAAVKRGVPIIGLRTSTHAFTKLKGTYASYNTFGKDVLGEGWVSHWGSHKHEATRGVVEPANKANLVLRGVSDVFGDTDVYEAHPPADATILLRGQVLKGMQPGDAPADYQKRRSTDKHEQGVNSPMMPVAWLRERKNPWGTTNRIMCTTMGSATDLQNAGLRRLVINAVYWGTLDYVPKEAGVDYVDAYHPSAYGFKGFRRGLKPSDMALGKPLAPPPELSETAWARGQSAATKPAAAAQPQTAQPAKLQPASLPLVLRDGERIALVGNSTAERMNLFGNFETKLHLYFPDKHVVFRNFARPADEVALRQRPNDYTALDDPLAVFGPETILCFFGFNESFAGPTQVEKFKADYDAFLNGFAAAYTPKEGKRGLRLVLVSPIAFEPTGNPMLPEGTAENANLQLYTEAVKAVAEKHGLPFVDVFTPSLKAFSSKPGMQYTINGAHANEAGDRLLAGLLDRALFGKPQAAATAPQQYEKLRAAVNDKSWVHMQDYRMLDGWYVYGGRRTWDKETFPREYVKIRNMAAVRDQYCWDIAAGKPVPAVPDDSHTGELIVPKTRFGEPRQKYSENAEGGPVILPPEKLIKTCEVPPGFEMKLFADESRFPEVAKPVQLGFDNRGRLWISTMPTYPLWRPGDHKPNDKLVILEDTDHDGRADRSTVFYDKLQCPTAFQFFDGGVLVVDQPRLIWLKDTDGDDRADEVVHVLDGLASDDTHHRGGSEFSPGGLLHLPEGVAMSTTLETPWGPFRNFGSSGAYVIDPRSWKIRHFNAPGYGNPWCYVFNEWGQGFFGDGTGANQHWDTPLSGQQYRGRKGMNPVFDTERLRPVVGSDFLVSRQFPDDVQGQFIYACVINMNGIPRWTFADDGAGYKGTRVRHDPNDPKTAFDLLKSTDKHFRPVDPKIGPDGALWFGDWANPLIGHMQYSQRDPNRDHVHGRIYRLVYTKKPLLEPVTQQGRSLAELFEQLDSYEWRTRYRVRREIQSRPRAEVLAALPNWLGQLSTDPASDRLRCEALWTQQSFHAVDLGLLKQLLAAETPNARAAATRVLADERERIPQALELLAVAAVDEHPRVATEAVRGLSFFADKAATAAVLSAIQRHPADHYVKFTVEAALGANIDGWRTAYLRGELAKDDPAAKKLLDSVIALDKKGAQLLPYLQILLGRERQSDEQRNKAMQALSDMRGGNAGNGKVVFRRTCTACHKVFDEGATFGPDMNKVATRLKRIKIVESIIDPNAEINEKYLTTQIITSDGLVFTGLLVSENKDEVVIFDGKVKKTIRVADIEERNKLKQSSMPEGMAATLSPVEFLDVVTFLGTLK